MRHKLTKQFKIKIIIITSIFVIVNILAYIAADRFLIEHVVVDVSEYENSEDIISQIDAEYTATDLSYISDTKSIMISKVVVDNNGSQLVYFVADVQLTEGTTLRSAFAKDKFGTNITEVPSVIAERKNAIFAVNGDYYGFRSNGIIIRNGVLYRNIPARTGLALYQDGSMEIYDETLITAEQMIEDGVWNTLSFGPALIDNSAVIDGINDIEIDTNFGNHSIQGYQPRTGLGIIDNNHFIFIVADGRNTGYSTGVTMSQFANLFLNLECSSAYNLDGGGSSEMWFMGNVINIPCNKNGAERSTSDILYII